MIPGGVSAPHLVALCRSWSAAGLCPGSGSFSQPLRFAWPWETWFHLLVIVAACIVSAGNAYDSRGHTRLFWSLMTAGMAMWAFNQACWVWFEVVVRKPLPDPFQGDIVLFLHVVPIMAAVAIRPHQADEREGMLPSALNVLILLLWWIVVYAFFVFPEEYIVTNVAVYTPRWDLLYLVEGLILIAVSASAFFTSSGAWRELYRNIFIRQRSLHILFGSHECRHRARHLQDWRTLRPPVPRRCAGVPLGRHRRAALPSRYPDDAFDHACQSPGRSSTCETRPALSAPHGILGVVPEPRPALSAPCPFCGGHGRRRPPGFCRFPQTTPAGPEASAVAQAFAQRASTICSGCREE